MSAGGHLAGMGMMSDANNVDISDNGRAYVQICTPLYDPLKNPV